MIKIAAVNYLNTKPWVHTINSHVWRTPVQLILLPPIDIAQAFVNNTCDIALLPIAALKKVKEFHFAADYCIGAYGKVASVILASNVPLSQCKAIYLDYESVTSVQLCKLIVQHMFKRNIPLLPSQHGYEITTANTDNAALIIGDRALTHSYRYRYIIDLAQAWYDWQHLPFVFAAWVSRMPLSSELTTELNNVLSLAVDNITEIAAIVQHDGITSQQKITYLTQNINYQFSTIQRQAVDLFLSLID